MDTNANIVLNIFNINCYVDGHYFALHDLIGLKQCLVCNKVEDIGYTNEMQIVYNNYMPDIDGRLAKIRSRYSNQNFGTPHYKFPLPYRICSSISKFFPTFCKIHTSCDRFNKGLHHDGRQCICKAMI